MKKERAVCHSWKNYIIIILLLLIACLHDVLFEKLFSIYRIKIESKEHEANLIVNIITSLLIAPLIETFLFQYLPFCGFLKLKDFKKNNYFKLAFVIFSTALFALSHSYSWIYIIVTIIPGLILSYYFYYFYERNNLSTAFYFISVLHFFKNTIALTDKYFF